MNNKGFTLIEVLVAVMIVAIMVGIGIPNYLKYKQKAVETSVAEELTTCVGLWAIEGGKQFDCSIKNQDVAHFIYDNDNLILLNSYLNVDNYKIKCNIIKKQGNVAEKFYIKCKGV